MPRHVTGKDVWMNCSGYPTMKLHGAILRSISGTMKLKRRVYEKDPDVNGLEKLSDEYNRASEEYTLLEMDLENSTQKLVIAKKALDEADSKLKRLEEKRQAIEELKRKEARLHSDTFNTTKILASLTERLQGKKTILDNLHQRQASIDSQIKQCFSKLEQAGLPIDHPPETLHSCLSTFDDQISGLRADQEATNRDLQTDKRRAATLAQENKCPLCIQPLDGEYKTNLLSRIEKENFEREKNHHSTKNRNRFNAENKSRRLRSLL